jgi:hypothetical protein
MPEDPLGAATLDARYRWGDLSRISTEVNGVDFDVIISGHNRGRGIGAPILIFRGTMETDHATGGTRLEGRFIPSVWVWKLLGYLLALTAVVVCAITDPLHQAMRPTAPSTVVGAEIMVPSIWLLSGVLLLYNARLVVRFLRETVDAL